MCIIIDTNVIACVFDSTTQNHKEFKPVYDWVFKGRGKIVYGGTKYLGEIKRSGYLNLLLQLKKAGKAKYVENEIVDSQTVVASSKIQHPDFDDQHIVGLLLASGCKLICSLDSRAYPFFRHNEFFSPSSKKPRIYRSQNNSNLLCEKNIADICLPCSNTTKAQRMQLGV